MSENIQNVTIPAKCNNCGCDVYPENTGFECDSFIECDKCTEQTGEDFQQFIEDHEKEQDKIEVYLRKKGKK